MTDLLSEHLSTVQAQLNELRPAYLLYLELEEHLARVAAKTQGQPAAVAAPAKRVPAASSARKPAVRQRPGRAQAAARKPTAASKEREGATVAKIKEIVGKHSDGISVGAIITEGSLSQSYTYDVVKRLVESGDLVKRSKKIFLGATPQRAVTASIRNGSETAPEAAVELPTPA